MWVCCLRRLLELGGDAVHGQQMAGHKDLPGVSGTWPCKRPFNKETA